MTAPCCAIAVPVNEVPGSSKSVPGRVHTGLPEEVLQILPANRVRQLDYHHQHMFDQRRGKEEFQDQQTLLMKI